MRRAHHAIQADRQRRRDGRKSRRAPEPPTAGPRYSCIDFPDLQLRLDGRSVAMCAIPKIADATINIFFILFLHCLSLVEARQNLAPPKSPPPRLTTQSPKTSTSILVRKKQSSASSGRHTTGSFSLNEVLSTIGTPVSSRNALIRP